MVPIKEIRPASQEEINEASFVFRKRGEKETGRKQKAREVFDIIKEYPGAVVSFVGLRYPIEAESFASLVRGLARSEEKVEVQTTIRKEEEPGKYTLFLRELPETEMLKLIEPTEYSPVLTWMFKAFAAIEEVCPAGPVHPEALEFSVRVDEGEDPGKMLDEWNEFVEKYTDEEGELDLSEYCDWNAEIPCPDCQTPLDWSRAIGYNNHIHVRCFGCGMEVHQ